MTYAIITPARNEAENLPRLAESLAVQTLLPDSWLIVDNGSSDDTPRIASELAARHDWIHLLSVPGADTPTRGGPIVRAFQEGVASLPRPVGVIVKVDADVTFEDGYFRRLLSEFEADPQLGMASGPAFSLHDGEWRRERVTGGHLRGAVRAYRSACANDVFPLEEVIGWDGVDEIKARLAGWRTESFDELPFRHHRLQGVRDGTRRRQWMNMGETAYYIGYRPSYVLLRGLFRMRREPWALTIVLGYVLAALARGPRCSDERVRAYVRRQQRLRAVPRRAAEVMGLSRRPI